MIYILLYFIVMNLVTFAFWGWDKWQSVAQKWRISEKMLLEMAALGGWLGALIGMQLFRHKTIKGSFLYWFYGIVVVWLVGIVLLVISF